MFPGVSASFPSQRSLAGFILEHPRDLSGKPCQNGGVLFEEARLPDTVVGSGAASSIRVTGKAPILRRSARVVFADGPPLATRCGLPSPAANVSHPDLPERRIWTTT